MNPDGSKTLYVYGNGLISQEQKSVQGTLSEYRLFHYDYRGSTTELTDIDGQVTDTFIYDPYGTLVERTGDTETIFLYVGREGVQTDDDGLYYMRARFYNPEIRRFVNEDPIYDGLNWYAYANGNAARFT